MAQPHYSIKILITCMIVGHYMGTLAHAQQLTLLSTEEPVMLLELFTSEGCSSCPPADRWLSRLKKDNRLWTEIVPVAYHVDYWNYLGWTDAFSSPEYSARQRLYARQGNARSVYTPGFFKYGREWKGWFRNRTLTANQSEKPVGPLKVMINKDEIVATFTPAVVHGSSLELNLAILGFDIRTDVRRGENSGKTLTHDFVVLDLTEFKDTFRNGAHHWQIPRRNLKLSHPNAGAIAVWISKTANPTPIQATGGWLQ